MAEIVFQMIAFGLEDIVVFVLTFPAGTTGPNNRGNRLAGQFVISDKSIMIELLAGLGMNDGHFNPVDHQSVLPTA